MLCNRLMLTQHDHCLPLALAGSDITHLFNGLDGITKGLDKLKVPLLIMGISAVVKQLKAFRD